MSRKNLGLANSAEAVEYFTVVVDEVFTAVTLDNASLSCDELIGAKFQAELVRKLDKDGDGKIKKSIFVDSLVSILSKQKDPENVLRETIALVVRILDRRRLKAKKDAAAALAAAVDKGEAEKAEIQSKLDAAEKAVAQGKAQLQAAQGKAQLQAAQAKVPPSNGGAVAEKVYVEVPVASGGGGGFFKLFFLAIFFFAAGAFGGAVAQKEHDVLALLNLNLNLNPPVVEKQASQKRWKPFGGK